MGRPMKVQDAITKTFRLPAQLVQQLNRAAELQQVPVSDVVREILEHNIRTCLLKSLRIASERRRSAITAVKADKELCAVFERCKTQTNAFIPVELAKDTARVALLLAALSAYRAQKAAGIE